MSKKKKNILKDKDFLILKELLEDGRKSASSISKSVDLGREIVNYRIKRLIKENLIVKFVPKVNESYDYSEYIVFLKLNLEDEISKENFVREAIGDKYLIWFTKHSGGWDVLVRVFAYNFDNFREKLNEILRVFDDYISNYYTIICSQDIKEKERDSVLEKIFKEQGSESVKEIKTPMYNKVDLDQKDMQIVEYLQHDARTRYTDIADEINISSDAVKYRVSKMVENKVLMGFYPVINFNKLGFIHYAFILRLRNLNFEAERGLVDFLSEEDCVIRAVRNLNAFEFFFTCVFDDEEAFGGFEERLRDLVGENLESLNFFLIR